MRLLPVTTALVALGMVTASCGGPADEGPPAQDQPPQQTGTAAPPADSDATRGNRPYEVRRIDAPDPQANGRWGERLATVVTGAGDYDGDGASDFFVGQPRYQLSDTRNAGRVWLMSGATGEVIYQIDPPQPQQDAKFGFFLSVIGDVNADDRADIAVGTDAQDVDGNVDQGAAWVFSGADGSLLYRLDNPEPQAEARFGSRIGRAGDVTGDDVPDIVVGASDNDVPAGCGQQQPRPAGCHVNQGQAFIFDGSDGSLVRTLNVPDSDQQQPSCSTEENDDCGSFGLTVGGPGDTNGDGVVDQLVSAPSIDGGRGRMYVFSGEDGSLLLTIESPDPQEGALFGFHEAAPLSPGDVNGDGRADIYGDGWLRDTPATAGTGEGKAWIFDGQSGEVLYPLEDPTPTAGGQFGWSEANTDYNQDGTPDVYVGQSPHHVAGTPQTGGTYVFDGRDGSLLQVLEVPVSDRQPSSDDNAGPRLGWSIGAPGDLNGDGLPDYLAGAPFLDVGENKDQGVVYVYLSQGSG